MKENEYTFNILIKAYTEAGQYNKAIEVFHQMQNRPDVRMDKVTLSSVMHLYNKMKRPDKTIDTFELYQQYNIEPDMYAYNCLINAYKDKTILKLHVIQFECYIVKVLNVLHIHFNQS